MSGIMRPRHRTPSASANSEKLERLESRGSEGGKRSAPLAILLLALVAVGALLIWLGRHQVMHGDDLIYAIRLSQHQLGDAILHSNQYLIVLPMLIYQAMFATFGIGSTLPYRLLSVALLLLCSALFFIFARKRVGNLLAIPPTVLPLLLGPGWDVLLTGVRIPALISICSGFGALLLLRSDDRRTNGWGAGLLSVSVTSHPTGLAFLAGSVTLLVFRPGQHRWQTAWVVLIPATLFAIWFFFFREGLRARLNGPGSVISFWFDSWNTLVAAVSGLSGIGVPAGLSPDSGQARRRSCDRLPHCRHCGQSKQAHADVLGRVGRPGDSLGRAEAVTRRVLAPARHLSLYLSRGIHSSSAAGGAGWADASNRPVSRQSDNRCYDVPSRRAGGLVEYRCSRGRGEPPES